MENLTTYQREYIFKEERQTSKMFYQISENEDDVPDDDCSSMSSGYETCDEITERQLKTTRKSVLKNENIQENNVTDLIRRCKEFYGISRNTNEKDDSCRFQSFKLNFEGPIVAQSEKISGAKNQKQRDSPIARILQKARRDNFNRTQSFYQKMSTRSFLYTTMIKQYIFGRDVKNVQCIYEEIRQTAERTDALQFQMDKHVNSMLKKTFNEEEEDDTDEVLTTDSTLEEIETVESCSIDSIEYDSEEDFDGFSSSDEKKDLNAIVEESITKLDNVMRLVRSTG